MVTIDQSDVLGAGEVSESARRIYERVSRLPRNQQLAVEQAIDAVLSGLMGG